jgi:hypothetical protein
MRCRLIRLIVFNPFYFSLTYGKFRMTARILRVYPVRPSRQLHPLPNPRWLYRLAFNRAKPPGLLR